MDSTSIKKVLNHFEQLKRDKSEWIILMYMYNTKAVQLVLYCELLHKLYKVFFIFLFLASKPKLCMLIMFVISTIDEVSITKIM